MKTTTSTTTNKNEVSINIDCEDSTAVRRAVVILGGSRLGSGEWVTITWVNGDKWGYFVPLATILPLLGEESVGRFANAVKREATYATKV